MPLSHSIIDWFEVFEANYTLDIRYSTQPQDGSNASRVQKHKKIGLACCQEVCGPMFWHFKSILEAYQMALLPVVNLWRQEQAEPGSTAEDGLDSHAGWSVLTSATNQRPLCLPGPPNLQTSFQVFHNWLASS